MEYKDIQGELEGLGLELAHLTAKADEEVRLLKHIHYATTLTTLLTAVLTGTILAIAGKLFS